MNTFLPAVSLLLAALLAPSCTTPSLMFASRTGELVGVEAVAEACADADIVVFGEQHHSAECHRWQRDLLVALQARRPDIIVSMEMLERDDQAQVDAYLAGSITEAELLVHTRGWKWDFYRPLMQVALVHGLDVVAANAPLTLVRQVSRGGGLAALRGADHAPREVDVPMGEPFAAFAEALGMEPKAALDPAASKVLRMYEAQCVRDESMAESVVDAIAAAEQEDRRPLVVHFCGNFHAAYGRGTVACIRRRMPRAAIVVIATTAAAQPSVRDLDPAMGDFHLIVPETAPSRDSDPVHPMPHPHSGNPSTDPGHKAQPEVPPLSRPHGHEPEKQPDAAPDDVQRRPALGFKPDYEGGEEPGVVVDLVTEGGPASKAGLRDGDRIVSVDGRSVGDFQDYVEVLSGLTVGKKVPVVVVRETKQVRLEVVVGERD
jgi:uncharacterized iron-regulated protein